MRRLLLVLIVWPMVVAPACAFSDGTNERDISATPVPRLTSQEARVVVHDYLLSFVENHVSMNYQGALRESMSDWRVVFDEDGWWSVDGPGRWHAYPDTSPGNVLIGYEPGEWAVYEESMLVEPLDESARFFLDCIIDANRGVLITDVSLFPILAEDTFDDVVARIEAERQQQYEETGYLSNLAIRDGIVSVCPTNGARRNMSEPLSR